MADTRVIKASFKDCPIEDRKQFFKSKCLMPISVGQMVHEGEKFIATLELINRTFNDCTILIDDTIQRYTYKIENENKSDSELYEQALREGDMWLERNIHIINSLTIPHRILRWDDWLKHPNYQNQKNKIDNYYNDNLVYKEAVDSNINIFLERYALKNEKLKNYEQAFNYCLEYLKEECACMCLWALEGYHFEVYPTGRNLAMTATYELLISPVCNNVLKSVSLRFKKYTKKECTIEAA